MSKCFYENLTDDSYYFNFHRATNNFMSAHYHCSTEMVFVISGTIKVIADGKEKILSVGEIGVFNCFDVHYINGDENSEIYVLVFGENFYPKAMNDFVLDNFLEANESTKQIFNLLDFFYQINDTSSLMIQQGLVEMLFGMLCKHYKITKKKTNNETVSCVKILQYINDNYAKPLTLESIASDFGYSKHYFSKLFNQFTGMHLREYLNRLRIDKMEVIKRDNKGESIESLAFKCGFNSLNTYYRALQKK